MPAGSCKLQIAREVPDESEMVVNKQGLGSHRQNGKHGRGWCTVALLKRERGRGRTANKDLP